MAILRANKYVMHMLNIGYLTGFARRLDAIKKETWHKKQLPKGWHGILVQQTNNIDLAIPVNVPATVSLPMDKTPVTVAFHAFGRYDAQLEEQTMVLESLDIERPSIRAMPTSMIWSLDVNAKHDDDDFRPFGTDGRLLHGADNVREDENYTETELVLQTMMQANKGKMETRYGLNTGVTMIAGFLEAFQTFVPSVDSLQKRSYIQMLLRQHKDPQASLPVRLYTHIPKSFQGKLRRYGPYLILGQTQVKIKQGENGEVLGGHLYIRTNDIHGADRVNHILYVPDWYSEVRAEMQKEAEERRKRMEEEAAKLNEKMDRLSEDDSGGLFD